MLTKKQAQRLYLAEFWRYLSDGEIAAFQLEEDIFCVPFRTFRDAIERTLGRSVEKTENRATLAVELDRRGAAAPPLAEILKLMRGV
ncbi:MAG: hypothetical protein GY832_47315 [Chloroflexi bacterium]|nr:hypothetical protein [Chloroflexota bacterium]